MKLFSRIVSILLLPLLIIGSINYFIDPDYTLRKNYIQPLASALANGKLVSGPVNINGRLLKKEWIRQLKDNPEVLILGSSRTLGITQASFPGKTFFNTSVTNCTWQDMYAFTDLMDEKKEEFPRQVIICCDQWLFGNSFSEKRWLYNRANFVNLLKKSSQLNPNYFPAKWELQKEWIKELFSVRYLIRSVRTRGKTEPFEIQDTIIPGKMMLLTDGSRALPSRITNADRNEVEKKAKDYFYSSQDEHFNQLDTVQCQLFENLISYLQNRKCQVTLFVPPYHPITWQLLHQSNKHTGIFKVDDYLQHLSKNKNLKIIGNTNPSKINLSSSDFYDGVHLKPAVLSRLITTE